MPIEANVTSDDEIRALLDKLDEETFRKVVTAAAKREPRPPPARQGRSRYAASTPSRHAT